MKRLITYIAAIIILAAGTAGSVYALGDWRTKIGVSGDGAYDYVIIGMRADATDGFDNAFDTMAPSGNLNDLYIQTSLFHPEWGQIKTEFRGDIRSIKELDTWTVFVYTNLPVGTPLSVGLLQGAALPAGYRLTLKDIETGQTADLNNAAYPFTVTATDAFREFQIYAEAVKAASFTITGKVTDRKGALLPNTKVTLVASRKKGNLTTIADAKGAYTFGDLPPGRYNVNGSLKRYTFKPVSVIITDKNVTVDIISKK